MSYLVSLLNHGALIGSAAAVQGLLVNRLGLAIAAIPAFVGLGAYLVVAGAVGPAQVVLVLACASVLGLLMVWLASRLRRDLYLLATLALIECLAAGFGSAKSLGAREGLLLRDGFIAPTGFSGDFETAAIPWCLGCLAVVLAWDRLLLSRAVGIAVDRLRESPESAGRWFPAGRIRTAVVAQAFILALAVGVIYAGYEEHVNPGIFSLSTALLVLAFSVVAGRTPELAALAAVLYWLLPFTLSRWTLIEGRTAAEVVRIAFGGLLVVCVFVPHAVKARRQSMLERACLSSKN